MLGVILTIAGSFFQEVYDSIGKFKVSQLKLSVYTMGFLGFFWTTFFYLLIIIFRGEFLFSIASLPFFIPRLFLEILQGYFTVVAVTRADRSTFGFVRVLTIPLLLLVDIFLGYALSFYQIAGIGLITIVIFLFFLDRNNNKKGRLLVLFTALNAVITISLFKYDITHFNSVEAEQFLTNLSLLFFFFLCAWFGPRENPLRFLFKPIYFLQSAAQGVSGLLYSFGMSFLPASAAIAVKRSSSIIVSTISGFFYFQERNYLDKLLFLAGLLAGIVLLVL